MSYPNCLIDELAKYGQKPTGNIDYDRAVLLTLSKRSKDAEFGNSLRLESRVRQCREESINNLLKYPNLANPNVYADHANKFIDIANEVLRAQHRTLEIDEHNRNVLRFLLYYFNNCALAEDVYPDRGYKLHKNIMLKGDKGVGKTTLMQCFSEYLRHIRSPRFFVCRSVTEMVDHYQVFHNIDSYTFNEASKSGPLNICLNDVGIQDNKNHYGTKTAELTDDFLLARNDIWMTHDKFAHITTNLDERQLITRFNTMDPYGRIVDRFKTYNVIELTGPSRR